MIDDTFDKARRKLGELMAPARLHAAALKFLTEGNESEEALVFSKCEIEYGEVRGQRGSEYEIDLTLRCNRALWEKLKPRISAYGWELHNLLMERIAEAIRASLPSGYGIANLDARIALAGALNGQECGTAGGSAAVGASGMACGTGNGSAAREAAGAMALGKVGIGPLDAAGGHTAWAVQIPFGNGGADGELKIAEGPQGRLEYARDFSQVIWNDEAFDLRHRPAARHCLEVMVKREAFNADSAIAFDKVIHPYVSERAGSRAQDPKIHHYFLDREGKLKRLRQELICNHGRSGKYYLKIR